MIGRLHTRCGCERNVDVAQDQKVVQVLLEDFTPLVVDSLRKLPDLDKVIPMRTFVFDRMIAHGGRIPLYCEVSEKVAREVTT